jgi:hypothetical protein
MVKESGSGSGSWLVVVSPNQEGFGYQFDVQG